MLSQVTHIFEIFEKLNQTPKTELEYTNNFTLLVAVVLSAQATDKRVNIITKNLFTQHDTPEKMLELGIDGLKEYIKSINYFNTKAKNIIDLSKILVSKYNSSVPNNIEDLTSLPGVGRKTANVVLNCAFGSAVMPVDTHIFRVSKKLGIAHGNSPEKVEAELIAIIPNKWLDRAHHWLVLHGRYICKARTPLCQICPVNKWCEYYKTSLTSI